VNFGELRHHELRRIPPTASVRLLRRRSWQVFLS
jgi:hypothetical protein